MKMKAIAVILETTKKVIEFETEIGRDMVMDASEKYDQLTEDPFVDLKEEQYDSNIHLCCYACRKLVDEKDLAPANGKMVCTSCFEIFESIAETGE